MRNSGEQPIDPRAVGDRYLYDIELPARDLLEAARPQPGRSRYVPPFLKEYCTSLTYELARWQKTIPCSQQADGTPETNHRLYRETFIKARRNLLTIALTTALLNENNQVVVVNRTTTINPMHGSVETTRSDRLTEPSTVAYLTHDASRQEFEDQLRLHIELMEIIVPSLHTLNQRDIDSHHRPDDDRWPDF